MERMNDRWFCANCLQVMDVLTRHGRCPYCDSNAVDVAYRLETSGRSREGELGPEIVLSINA